MKCPEINNKKFISTRKAVGTKVAYNVFKKNNDNYIDKARNGNDSIFFRQLLDVTNTDEEAIALKAASFSKEFNNKINWLSVNPMNKTGKVYPENIQKLRNGELRKLNIQNQIDNHLTNESTVKQIISGLESKLDIVDMETFRIEYKRNPDKALKMLASKSAVYEFTYDINQDHSGKSYFNKDLGINIVEMNLAKMNDSTPIHEILGHTVIRSVKQSNPSLYDSLQKELRSGKGLKKLNEIKSNYGPLVGDVYSEQDIEEETIVHLLTDYIEGNIDSVKDKGLFAVLKQLMASIKNIVKDILSHKKINIEMLPDNLTIKDLSDVLSFSKGKIKMPSNSLLTKDELNSMEKRYNEAKGIVDEVLKKESSDPMFLYIFDDKSNKEQRLNDSFAFALNLSVLNEHPRMIKKLTGWEQLPFNGHWIYDKPDNLIDTNDIEPNKLVPLDKYLDKDIQKLYNDVTENFRVVFSTGLELGAAYIQVSRNLINIGIGNRNKKPVDFSDKANINSINEAFFHEVQHLITSTVEVPIGSSHQASRIIYFNRYSIPTNALTNTLWYEGDIRKHLNKTLEYVEINNKWYVKNKDTGTFVTDKGFDDKIFAKNKILYDVISVYDNYTAEIQKRDEIYSEPMEITMIYRSHIGEMLSYSAGDRAKVNMSLEERRNALFNEGLVYDNIQYGLLDKWDMKGIDNNGDPILVYSTLNPVTHDYENANSKLSIHVFKETEQNNGNSTVPSFLKDDIYSMDKRGSLQTSNMSNVVPLFGSKDYDINNNQVISPVPQMVNEKVNSYPVEMKKSMPQLFPSRKLTSVTNNKVLFPDDNNNVELAKKIMNSNKQRLGMIITKSLETMFPDINFIYETNQTALIHTGKDNTHGWVDNNGNVHVNIESMDPNTSIHELGHILEPLIKRKHPELYKLLMNELEKGIRNKNGVYYAIYKNVENGYNDINTHKAKMSEVFAEGLAAKTMDTLYEIMAGNPDLAMNMRAEMNMVKDDFEQANDAAERLFDDILPDSKITTMDGLANMLANNMVNGTNHVKFTKEDKTFLNEYFNSIGAQYKLDNISEEMSKANIIDAKKLLDFFKSNNFDKPDPLTYASNLASNLINNTPKGETRIFRDSFNDTEYEFGPEETHEQISAEIYDSYVKPLMSYRKKIKSKIIESYVPNMSEQIDLDVLFGDDTSTDVINKLRLTMGLDDPVNSIMLYSDLNKHPHPSVQKLHDSTMEGYNPIVVIHDIDEDSGVVSLSVIDLQATRLGESFKLIGDQNIYSNIMTDEEYNNRTPQKAGYISMRRNTEADLRLLGISLLTSHFENTLGDKVKFNKLGVVHVSKHNFAAKMIIDVEAQMENLAMLNDIDGFMKGLEESRLKESIKRGAETDYSSVVSYIGLLKSHLLNIVSDESEEEYFGYSAEDLLNKLNEGSPEAQLIVLDAMKIAISKQLNGASPTSNAIYMLITKASRELRTNRSVTYNEMKDIGELAMKFKSMYHMDNDYVQDVITAVQETTFRITDKAMKDIRKLGGTTKKPGLARKIKNRIMKQHVGTAALSFVGDTGSKLYGHLYKYKVVKVLDEHGNFKTNADKSFVTKKVKMPELHWDINDADTKKALDEGILTKEDIEFNNIVLDTLEQRWKEVIKHHHQKNIHISKVKLMNLEDDAIEKQYKAYFPKRGMIPTIEVSASEMLFSGKAVDAAKKSFSQLSMSEALFEDVGVFDDVKEEQLKELGGFFMTQAKEEKRLRNAGLTYAENGEIAVFDEIRNDNVSTDLWKSFNYINQSLIRKVEYEKNVLPVAQDSLALLKQLGEGKQDNNIKLVKEIIDRNAYRKNADEKKPLKLGKYKVDFPPIARGVKKAWNMAMLPGRVSLGVLSTVFNTSAIIMDSLASTILESNGALPPIKYFIQAAKESFTIKGAQKMRSLSLDFHIWGRSEMELLTDPFINVSDHSIFNSMFGNIFNWASDAWARSLVMSAVMMKDGSWDAHVYNEKSGEIEYDETKDLRFYDKDGVKKTDANAIALYEGIKRDIQDTYGLDTPPEKLPQGYGMTDALYMKQLADTRIIGAFSDDVQALITNRWIGNLFMQYRTYATVRAFNMGIFGNELKSSVGQRIVPVQLKDGTWISKREIMDLEGAMQSFGTLVSDMEKISINELQSSYNSLNETQKLNIIRTFLRTGFFLLAFALLLGFDDDDPIITAGQGIAYKWAGDILFMNSFLDIIENPIPSFDATKQMVTSGEFQKILPYYKAVSNTAESFTDES